MTAVWPELRPEPEAVALDTDDPTVVARAVWLAIADGLMVRRWFTCPLCRHLVTS